MIPINGLTTLLKSSPLAASGLFLMVMSSVLAPLKAVPANILDWIKKKLLHSVTINSKEYCYEAILFWVTEEILKGKPRNTRVTASRDYNYDSPASKNMELINFEAGEGHHIGWVNHRPIMVYKSKEKDDRDRPTGKYELTITFLGINTKAVKGVILKALTFYDDNYPKTINAHFPASYGGEWAKNTNCHIRSLAALALSGSAALEVIKDVQNFRDSKEEYEQHGMQYKRTYLLSGPPGGGKSSLVQGIANKFRMSIYHLDLHGLSNSGELTALIGDVPTNSIVLVEDVDCVTVNREEDVTKEKSGRSKIAIPLSSILNVLDGLHTKDGCIYFLTTNYRDRLDPALIRPGRVDKDIYIGPACKDQLTELFGRFFPEESPETFVNECLSGNYVIAKAHQRLVSMKFGTQGNIDVQEDFSNIDDGTTINV